MYSMECLKLLMGKNQLKCNRNVLSAPLLTKQEHSMLILGGDHEPHAKLCFTPTIPLKQT